MNDSLKVFISQNDYQVWLVNGTSTQMDLRAGELFGFGQGEFKPMPVGGKQKVLESCMGGVAKGGRDGHMPWLMESELRCFPSWMWSRPPLP